jgi:aminobenzoyl-glutamate utilization protein B
MRGARLIHGLIAIACATGMPMAASAQSKPSGLKARAVAGVEARTKLAQVVNDSVFSFAELGLHETETSRYLTDLLEKEGFKVERGVSGLPTGWVARWTHGSSGPVIAVGSDIDGIPKASQKPGIPWHDPMVPGGPGHGEGHNSGQAVNIVAALAVKELMEKENISGTLVLWPGVAEELLAGKAYFVRDGVFKGVDAVLFTHVSNNLGTAWGQPGGTGLVSVEYTFAGESAHSAGAPWRGKSALDGVMLMGTGWDFRREHLRPEQRSHYVITDGGDQPNVVPQRASIWFYFREIGFDGIKKNFEIGNTIADAAAKMTDTTVTRRILGAAAPRHFNKPMAEAAYANIKMVGLPQWSADDQAFAKVVQTNLKAEKVEGLATKIEELKPPVENPPSGGSDDIGDVAWTVPTITIGYPSNIPGLPGHNWSNAIAMATPIAHKGVVAGAKVMAMTMIDLLTKPELLKAAKTYFTDVQTKDQKYVPMITAADKPVLELNTEIMARFKPELSKYYYQPDRYGTYLEQLGIKWPTLTKADAPKEATGSDQ